MVWFQLDTSGKTSGNLFFLCMHPSLHPEPVEHRISRAGVETGLEFGEQFSWYGGNITHARHGEKHALGTRIEGALLRSKKVVVYNEQKISYQYQRHLC